MNRLLSGATALTIFLLLGGCVAGTPSAAGTSVRAIMASQAVPPQPQPERGTDGAAAVAAYVNYQRSFTTPTAQSDRAAFGSK